MGVCIWMFHFLSGSGVCITCMYSMYMYVKHMCHGTCEDERTAPTTFELRSFLVHFCILLSLSSCRSAGITDVYYPTWHYVGSRHPNSLRFEWQTLSLNHLPRP